MTERLQFKWEKGSRIIKNTHGYEDAITSPKESMQLLQSLLVLDAKFWNNYH
jgi:hypothetical protein